MGEATRRRRLFWLYLRPGRGNRRPSTAPAANPIASDRNGCCLIACAASSSLSSAVCRLLFNNRRASSNLSATAALASCTPFSSRCAASWTFFPTLAHAAGAPLARSSSKALFTWNSSSLNRPSKKRTKRFWTRKMSAITPHFARSIGDQVQLAPLLIHGEKVAGSDRREAALRADGQPF